ncbi:MAG TPA: hypothetical protein VK992_00210 [Candidatus Caenarcaniphilales bacterium]|nr:hypothetical protein [Candidatus Caenarcaniphilales bacterium]
MVEEDYDELLDFERSPRYDERQKAALLYTSMIIWNPEGADDAVWARLREHFSPEEIAEIGYLISFISVQQRWIKTLALGHGEVLNLSAVGLAPHAGAA